MAIPGKKKSRAGRSLTAKGAATRAEILETAHEVFKEGGYYGSSISEITRRCGVSMATFYQYFRNKEEVFLELNEVIISHFTVQVESLSEEGLGFEDRLRNSIQLLFSHTQNNFAFHRILGEAELTDQVTVAYYESIAGLYRETLSREMRSGNMRALDPNVVAYGLLGICYFNSLEWGANETFSSQEMTDLIMDLLMKGINGPSPWKRPPGWDLFSMPEPIPLESESFTPLTKGEKTRRSIFRAAEKVFGQYGFHRGSIADITREAGVAQGTFYIHFASKSDLIEGFVRYINHEMRRELQRVAGNTADRRDAERVGVLTFFEFLLKHKQIYRVVPECEMIRREVALWYYQSMAKGYIRGLEQGMEKEEIRGFPPAFLARSLMGLVHFVGLKWVIWNADPHPVIPNRLRKDLIEFFLYGLKVP
jgi:AcrR family transcriptional regulator